ncbi:MAG: hypothetical protein Q9219_005389 [cf. Caloplaca sp. 3 TL-2023]
MHLHPSSLLLLLLTLTLHPLPSTTTTTNPSPPLTTQTIHHLSHPSPPAPLATLTFSPHHPHLSILTSITPPPNSTSLLQIGICFPSAANNAPCRTTAAYAYSFHAPYEGRFKIWVDKDGEGWEVVGVAWKAWDAVERKRSASSKALDEKRIEKRYEEGVGRGDFDVRIAGKAPEVWIDRDGAKGRGKKGARGGGAAGQGRKDGEGEEEEEEQRDERSFLQKYWWVILAVTVFAMAGGGPDK